jgi:hypothetical protein
MNTTLIERRYNKCPARKGIEAVYEVDQSPIGKTSRIL